MTQQHCSLKLYICGMSQTSEQALDNLRLIFSRYPRLDCQLDIIDVLERPDIAEAEGIVATPTLVRDFPSPRQYLIGNLTDEINVKRLLGINAQFEQETAE